MTSVMKRVLVRRSVLSVTVSDGMDWFREREGRGVEDSQEADQEIPEPIASGGQGHAMRAVAGRVQLCDDGPD